MKINEELVKQYIDFENKETKIIKEIKQYKCNKYQELYSNYEKSALNTFLKIRNRICGFSTEFFTGFIFSMVLLLPVIISLLFTTDIYSLNLKFVILIGICGLLILSYTTFIGIRDFKLTRLYRKLTKKRIGSK